MAHVVESVSPDVGTLPPLPQGRLVPTDYAELGQRLPLWRHLLRDAEFRQFSDDVLRAAYWTLRLMNAFEQRADALAIPAFRYASYGFLNAPLDPNIEQNTFGVARIGHPSPESADEPVPLLEVDGFLFPVLTRRPTEILHGPGVVPVDGSAGCWAKSRVSSPTPLGPGVLTAKHVAGSTLNQQVALSDGTYGAVLDVGPDGVDAAIVRTPEPPGLARIVALESVFPWLDVEFFGQTSGYHATKVKEVTETYGVLTTDPRFGPRRAIIPARVFLGTTGMHGDSGALVTLSGQDVAVGIYSGELADPTGTPLGVAQHVCQAALCMDMELYR